MARKMYKRMAECRDKLAGLVKGWKTRKMMKSKVVQGHLRGIKDMEFLIKEYKNDDTLGTVVQQYPALKERFIRDLHNLVSYGIPCVSKNRQRKRPIKD